MNIAKLIQKVLYGTKDGRLQKYYVNVFWIFIIVFSLIYSFMSLNNHRLFETYGWDLAVFDHGVWQWSQFRLPYSSFHDLPWLADHFHLILISIAPIYWLFSDVRVLLIVQALLTCVGAIPIYFLSRKVTKHEIFSLVLVLGYLTFYSLQWHTFSGFHELAFLPITLGAVMYFWESKNAKMYWILFTFALLVKEEIGFLLAAFGIWAYLNDKSRRRQALVSILVGFISSIILLSLIMPWVGQAPYRHLGYGKLGDTPFEVVINLIKNPLLAINAFVDSPQKISTMFVTSWPWIFMPVFAPTTLIVVFEQFAIRFLDYGKTIRWTPFFAYSLPMATIMAWGSVYGFRNFVKKVSKKLNIKSYILGTCLSGILLFAILIEDISLHAPINSLFKKTYYRTEEWMIDNGNAIDCIPDDVSVSAQNNLAPRLSERYRIKVFPEGVLEGFSYIIVDLHKGQSENSFHFLGSKNTQYLINDLVEKGLYKVKCQYGEAMVLERTETQMGELKYSFPLEIEEK